jgi:hypothetical protein
MSAALRLVEEPAEEAPASSRTTLGLVAATRAARATMHPTMRPSLRPTLVPSSRPTVRPMSEACARISEPPTTQRSPAVQTRHDLARIEVRNILGLMRCNVSFLETLLRGNAPLDALGALEDLHQGLDRLEDRFLASLSLALPRTR